MRLLLCLLVGLLPVGCDRSKQPNSREAGATAEPAAKVKSFSIHAAHPLVVEGYKAMTSEPGPMGIQQRLYVSPKPIAVLSDYVSAEVFHNPKYPYWIPRARLSQDAARRLIDDSRQNRVPMYAVIVDGKMISAIVVGDDFDGIVKFPTTESMANGIAQAVNSK